MWWIACVAEPVTEPIETESPRVEVPVPAPTAPPTPTVPTEPGPDCSIRPEPVVVGYRDDIWPSEDFTFADDGTLWGIDTQTNAVYRMREDEAPKVMLPYLMVGSLARGMRFLPDGDLVVAEPSVGAVLRIDHQTLGFEAVAGGFNGPNGIAIRDDGTIYLTQAIGDVVRIDLQSGTSTVLFESPVSTDGITFAPDYERLYFVSEDGEVMTLVLDDDGAVLEPASVLTTIPTGGAAILDGMTADVCGNLYVVVMNGLVVRVLPDGTQEPVADLDGTASLLISAANFGSGVGGWERDHLYVMSLWEGMFEIDIGIEGKWEPHLP